MGRRRAYPLSAGVSFIQNVDTRRNPLIDRERVNGSEFCRASGMSSLGGYLVIGTFSAEPSGSIFRPTMGAIFSLNRAMMLSLLSSSCREMKPGTTCSVATTFRM